MFKSWKGEKKMKAIFEMQFEATQVPLLKAKKLMVSLVPVDVGKPTVRVDKTPIVQGNCIWENPIYETVKLVRETKTGRFREKVYYLVVSTGSSRKCFLGEASIDFADLAEASGVMMLSLPLQPSDSGAILHVTVHRMQPAQDLRNGVHDDYPMGESNGGCLEAEDQDCDIDRRSGLREGDPSLDHGSTTTDNSSHDLNYIPQKAGVDSENPNLYKHSRTSTDWSSESASEGPEDNFQKETVNETSQNTIGRLENNIQVLERQAEFSELEIQSLRKQVAKENRREQELSKQIISLKDERDSFKTKYEQIKSLPDFVKPEKASIDPQADTECLRGQLGDMKIGLQHEQLLNKKLSLKLQKAEDSNSELVLAIRDLNKRLNQKDTEMSQLSSKLNKKHETTSAPGREPNERSDPLKAVRDMPKVSEGHSNSDEAEELKQKIKELHSEIEEYNKDNERLRTQVESISQKYEILNNENKTLQSDLDKTHIEMVDIQREHLESLSTAKWLRLQTERLEKEIKKQELKYSDSLEAINELETEITMLEKELERQAREFQDHLEGVTQVNIKQENRARAAEDALHMAKCDAAEAVDRLHVELRKVTIDVSSKINENEKIATVAIAEVNDLQLRNHVLEELLEKTKIELSLMKELHERKLETNESNETEVSNLVEDLSTSKKTCKGGESKNTDATSIASTETLRCFYSEEIGWEKEGMNFTLQNEMFEVKERNRHMEVELKEMQERYSDISLKFAEVEGERQQLVMTLRNLKRRS